MTINNRNDIDWAPKVSLSKIRRLYMLEAQGICDDELIEEVGMGLYSRCESILEFTEAIQGLVKCKRCARSGMITMIERMTHKTTEIVKCPVCAWQIRWRVYVNEAEKTGGNLMEGHAGAAFERYVQTYPKCQNARDKILAIDLLIHEFHWILQHEGKEYQATLPHKPAGVNLLQGSTNQILELLNGLPTVRKLHQSCWPIENGGVLRDPLRKDCSLSRRRTSHEAHFSPLPSRNRQTAHGRPGAPIRIRTPARDRPALPPQLVGAGRTQKRPPVV